MNIGHILCLVVFGGGVVALIVGCSGMDGATNRRRSAFL